MKNRNLLTLLTLSLAICLVGCAEPPTAGVDAANARLDAVANDGNTYAADAYRSAEAAATALDAELDTQAASFVLFRSYERAIELIGSVETAVDAVENAIEAEKMISITSSDAPARSSAADASTSSEQFFWIFCLLENKCY